MKALGKRNPEMVNKFKQGFFETMPAGSAIKYTGSDNLIPSNIDVLAKARGGVVYAQDGMKIPNGMAAYKAGMGPYSTNTPSRIAAFDSEKANEQIDTLSTGLSVMGMVPVIGEPFDMAAAALDAARGDYVSAGLSMASSLPVAGSMAGVSKLARKMSMTPPPLPKSFVKPLPEYGPPTPTDADRWFNDMMMSIEKLPSPQEGMTRLFRIGDIPRDYVPPKTANWYGQQIPHDEWLKKMASAKKNTVAQDTTPIGAAGKWFTDAPNELDFYIRRDSDKLDQLRSYYKDIPTSDLNKYNVANTQFKDSSANVNREFILPTADEAIRFKGPLGPSGYYKGGVVYANNGMLVPYQPKGTDTVPAMLTPGEFVVNRKATQQNLSLLHSVNSGHYNQGGRVKYLADGGGPQFFGDISMQFTIMGTLLTGLNQELTRFGGILQGFQQPVGRAQPAANNGNGVNNGIAGFVQKFDNFIQQLSKINIPAQINLQMAPTRISVDITGAQFLQSLQPAIQSVIIGNISAAMNTWVENNFDGIAPPDFGNGS
jgi:hypothetical protein